MRERIGPAEDINLVPVMNLVTILIPFLLMSAQFVTAAVIDTTAPSSSKAPAEEEAKPEAPRLTIAITDLGYVLAGPGAVMPLIPLDPTGRHDTATLGTQLSQARDAFPDQRMVVLAPEPAISFEVLVATMDAAKGKPERPLFDDVVISGGAAEE